MLKAREGAIRTSVKNEARSWSGVMHFGHILRVGAITVGFSGATPLSCFFATSFVKSTLNCSLFFKAVDAVIQMILQFVLGRSTK